MVRTGTNDAGSCFWWQGSTSIRGVVDESLLTAGAYNPPNCYIKQYGYHDDNDDDIKCERHPTAIDTHAAYKTATGNLINGKRGRLATSDELVRWIRRKYLSAAVTPGYM
jgi:hypothetical protein